MSTNTVMFSWKRALAGRERLSAVHFDDFVAYLNKLRADGQIQSFEPVLLEPNASDIIGFFLIRGEGPKLNDVLGSSEWTGHMVRAMFHLDEPSLIRGVSGPLVQDRMDMWIASIPQ